MDRPAGGQARAGDDTCALATDSPWGGAAICPGGPPKGINKANTPNKYGGQNFFFSERV